MISHLVTASDVAKTLPFIVALLFLAGLRALRALSPVVAGKAISCSACASLLVSVSNSGNSTVVKCPCE